MIKKECWLMWERNVSEWISEVSECEVMMAMLSECRVQGYWEDAEQMQVN
jgi:hypothetical protein